MALTSVRPASLIVLMRAEYRALKSSKDAGRIVRIQFSSPFSPRRDCVTGRRKAPNSFAEARMERPSNDKGADNVDEVYEARSCDFTSGIAGGDVGNRECGRDDLRQALLAERSGPQCQPCRQHATCAA